MPATLSSPILVGRATELAALDVALQRAVGGESSVVLIGGDAGLGKSRLIAEFADGARRSGARVLVGGCIDLGGDGLPYGPFLEALRALGAEVPPAKLSALLGEIAPELVALVPEFATFLVVEPPAGGPAPTDALATPRAPAAADQGRLFELTLALISRLSGERPLVLALEDLHWSDPASRDLLAFLARNLRQNPVLLLGTYRTDDLGRGHPLLARFAEMARLPNVDRIELRPLDLDEQRNQLTGILGRQAARGLVERIHARAQGNPFFAEELLASESVGERRNGELVPQSLRDILLGRIATLGPATQRVLGVAAVAGVRADDRLLAAVTGLPEDELVESIREAVARQVLAIDERTATYRFRHALMSEVTHADLLPGERVRLHAAVAEYLVAAGHAGEAVVAAELAHHWLVAERPREALLASVDAARSATGIHAHADALRHLERAMSLFETVPGADELLGMDRVELLVMAADAADRTGSGPRAVELARAALDLFDNQAEPIRAGLIHSRLAYYLWVTGESQAAIAEHRAAVAAVPAEPPSPERARVVGGLASILMPTGRYRESRLLAEEALQTLHATASREGEGRLLNVLGVDLVGLGEVDVGLDYLRKAVTVSRAANEIEGQLGAMHNLAFFLAQTDHLEEGLAIAMEGLETAQRVGLLQRYGANLRATAGDILNRSGRWDEADQVTREGLDLDSDSSGSIYLRATRAMFLSARGALDAAGEDLAAADAVAGSDVDPDIQAYLLQAHAELDLVAGRPADALRSVEEALAQYAGSDEYLLVAPLIADGMAAAADLAEHGRAFRTTAEVDAATANATSLREMVRTIADRTLNTSAATPSLRAVVATAEAEWTRLSGQSDAGSWTQAAEAWDAVPMPYPAARARARAGEALLLARGSRDDAAQHLRAAHRAATDLGAVPLRTSIEAIATRARIDLAPEDRLTAAAAAAKAEADGRAEGLPPAERTPAEILGLSAREWEVLELVAAGRSNAEIAETLYISPKTASVHVTHILDKLGVNNRVEAATIAVRVGAGEIRPGA